MSKSNHQNSTLILNPNFTFDMFIVGNSNRFAYAAGRGAADLPGLVHNPLFIYSGVGLGKTHLISAIGNELIKNNSDVQVIYTTAEQFANELIEAIERHHALDNFHNKYRNVDCLLIDDIQFLADKDRPQMELIHTFDVLYTMQKQVVFTSDRPPKSMSHLDARLQSRFEGGLVADIQSPDFETRVAILHKKASLRNFTLEEDIAYEIARHIKSNVRELEGFLNQMIAISSLDNQPLTIDWVQKTLSERYPGSELTPKVPEKNAAVPKEPPLEVKTSTIDEYSTEEPPEEFGNFIAEVEENVDQTIAKRKKQEEMREFYRQKLYVWEMKGFNVSRLQRVIDGEIEEIERAFREYTRDARRLAEYEKQLACLDIRGLRDEARKIEQNLFNPDAVDQIEIDLRKLETQIERRRIYRETIIPDFRFTNFVEGESNRMVVTVVKSVSENPAKQYNPLYIYGGVGFGKTHLLNAIGNNIIEKNQTLNVLYVSVDSFAGQLIKAIEERTTDHFRSRYNEIDVLLMDDIQQLSGKERTQEEFFHFFNTLYSVRKQIIIAGDRPPNQLMGLEDRLRSRFEGGLVIELKSPDHHIRKSIVHYLIEHHHLSITSDAVRIVIDHFSKNIRELQGAVNRMIALASVNGNQKITVDLVHEAMGELPSPVQKETTPPPPKPAPPSQKKESPPAQKTSSQQQPEPSKEMVKELLERMVLEWNKPPQRLKTEL